tara:strand:- start:16746 stop:17531 length:786 start_codon:yes stop_codon:yes gene_type:complete
MSWKYPPEPIRPGQVVSIDNLNENFLAYTEEITGTLNEHNFDVRDGTLLTRAQLASDAAFRLHTSRPLTGPHPNDFVDRTGWLSVRRRDGWQTYTDDDGANTLGMGLKFNAVGSLCWICGSINLHAGSPYTLSVDTALDANDRYDRQLGYGFNIAIQVDGVTVYESLLGSADSMNEFYNGPSGKAQKSKITANTDLDTPLAGGGVNGVGIAVVVDAIVDIPPGVHDVKIAVMSIKGNGHYGAGKPSAYISTRELFVLELIR